ncbi:pth11-like protein [Colletotrichum incanum]|uniref:Pth11-like protein n=1 Tax=Colletotrichum incanum TaxID=1573173 RepID=A0A161Y036_COLIC|nr:pth11-like protein [Colletotrichum incanum]
MDFQTSQPWLLSAINLAFGIGGAIAILTLCARLAIRQSQNALEWDDYLMLPAWILSVVAQPILIVAIRSAHPELSDVAEIARLLSHSLTKKSLVLLYLRIFPSKWQTRAGWAVLAVISAYTIAISGLLIHHASASAFFNPMRTSGDTPGTLQLPIAATGVGIITDLLLVILPIPAILRVRIKPMDTLRVILLWCSPVVGTITSSVRLYFLLCLPGSFDPTADAAMAIISL